MANESCKNCYRWKVFKERCYYYWENKEDCHSKVTDEKEMVDMDSLRQRQ